MKTDSTQRNTKQRQIVLDTVMGRCDHPTVDEIYEEIHKSHPKVSKGTVYRNLNVLSENGEITHVRVPAADRYDSRLDKHYHLICMKCGKVTDAPIEYREEYDKSIFEQTGFAVNRHRMIFEGICSECQKKDRF